MTHWLLERLSSLLLLPIGAITLVSLVSSRFEDFHFNCLGSFGWVVGAFVVLVLFYHRSVGIQSLLRDYVTTSSLLYGGRIMLNVTLICRAKEYYVYFVVVELV